MTDAIPPPDLPEGAKPPSIVPADVLDDLRSLVPLMHESAKEREARKDRERVERRAAMRRRIALQIVIALGLALECLRVYLEGLHR